MPEEETEGRLSAGLWGRMGCEHDEDGRNAVGWTKDDRRQRNQTFFLDRTYSFSSFVPFFVKTNVGDIASR